MCLAVRSPLFYHKRRSRRNKRSRRKFPQKGRTPSSPSELALSLKDCLDSALKDNPLLSEAQMGIQAAAQGGGASLFRVPGEDGFVIRARLQQQYREDPQADGIAPCAYASRGNPSFTLGRITGSYMPTLLTRQGMVNSIDIYGYREKAPVSHIMENVEKALKGIALPPGYSAGQRSCPDPADPDDGFRYCGGHDPDCPGAGHRTGKAFPAGGCGDWRPNTYRLSSH